MRQRYPSHHQPSLGFLLGIVTMVSALSLLVFFLMGAGLTGFAALDPVPPSTLNLTLDPDSYAERSLLEGDVITLLDGPLLSTTTYYAMIDGKKKELPLPQALDAAALSYQLSSSLPRLENSSLSTTLIYNGAGTRSFVARLPKNAKVTSIAMNVHGLIDQGSYPSFPKIDVNRDGHYEWEYVGDFVTFNETYYLPSGLNEQQENSVTIDEKDIYYCELISLPRAKDFQVFAKYGAIKTGGDLEIVLFSVSGSGDTLTGQGGTEHCDLPETGGAQPSYQSCSLKTSYPLQGNHLLCVHQAERNLPPSTSFYELSRDIDKGSGYRCGSVSSGKTTCTSQQGDFFIKAQAGQYKGVLDKQILLSEGAPDALLPLKFNEHLKTCTAVDGACFLTLDITSESKGILYLDNLVIEYLDQNTVVREKSFYTISTTTPVITSIAGKELSDGNFTLTLPLDILQAEAPTLSSRDEAKNFTLEVGFTPGPSAKSTILVTKTNATTDTNQSNQTFTGNFSEDASFYTSLFTSFMTNYAEILEIGGYKQPLQTVLQGLKDYERAASSQGNDSNMSLAVLEQQLENQIKGLPQYIASLGSISFTPSVSVTDFKDDYVYSQQRDLKMKQQLAALQQQYAPKITVNALEVVLFNKQKQEYTLLEHSTSASFSAGKMLTFFPSGVSSLTYTTNPEKTLSSSPLVVSWSTGSLPSTMKYVIRGNLLNTASDVKVIFIPETLPQQREPSRTRCGDGVCSVLQNKGQKILLEDAVSCPQDCGGGEKPWMMGGALLLLAVILLFYFGGLYKGPGNFPSLFQKLKKQSSSKTSSGRGGLFISSQDEQNLRSYAASALKKGVTEQQLRETLLNRGWTKQQVDAVLKQP